GSNSFHGEGFEFLRNNSVDARNFFDHCPTGQATCKDGGRPPFKRNQFGANFGGPIIKNKTFFFFSYEALRQRQGLTFPTNVVVPTDAQRATVTNPTVIKLLALIPPSATGAVTGSGTAPVNIN